MKIDKIYHVGDIHYRNVKRHSEYRYVLTHFIESVRHLGTDNSVIYIAGDIAHAKLEMSPELVSEISWFLSECSKLCPTILIAGNHDCNMANLDRLDVITPIVNALNNPNIIYLKDTMLYEFDNVVFSVYSIFDKKTNWIYASDKRLSVLNKKKIALFHGPVDDALTDVGYTINTKHFTSDIFDGFDAALLGDIHKRQEIISPSGCKVVYCGSMVQQNFGETVNGHGFLVWDVNTMTYDAYDIHNPYGYYTVDIYGGQFDVTTDIPSTAKVRVRICDANSYNTKEIVGVVKKTFGVSDVTVIRKPESNTPSHSLKESYNMNISDVNVQLDMILNYISSVYELSESDINTLRDIHYSIYNELKVNDYTKNNVWSPVRFEFDNMFSYGEGNVIDFTDINGLVGVFGPNAVGKSSIYDAISFCLFDKCSRAFKASHVMNTFKNSFRCKLDFSLNGELYTIERTGSRANKDKNVKVDVNFYRHTGDIPENLNGTDRRDTNAIIQKYVGTYDDFILTTLSLQGNNSMFIDKGQTERKELLAQFMGLSIFDLLYNRASEIYKDNVSSVKFIDIVKLKDDINKFNDSLSEKENELHDTNMLIAEKSVELDMCNNTLIDLHTKLINIEDVEDIGVLNESMKSALSNLTNKQREYDSHVQNYDILKRKLSEVESSLSSIKYTYGDLVDKVNDYKASKGRLLKLNFSLDILDNTIKTTNDKIEHLSKHKYDPNCEFCVNNVFVIDAIKTKDSLNTLISERDSVCKDRDALMLYVDSLELYTGILDSYNEIKSTKDKLHLQILTVDNDIAKLSNDIINLKNLIERTNEKIKLYYKNEESITHNNKIQDEIRNLETIKSKLEYELKMLNSSNLVTSSNIGYIKSSIHDIRNQIDLYNTITKVNNVYGKYIEAVKRDNLPYRLIYDLIPVLESEVNTILHQIVEFSIELEMDGKNINTKIIQGAAEWPLEMASGMERFVTGIAIRVALIKICSLPRSNFLVMDEGLGTLDSDNLSSIFSILHYLKTQFEFVWIISHIDTVRDVVDRLVEIKKKNGFSKVIV